MAVSHSRRPPNSTHTDRFSNPWRSRNRSFPDYMSGYMFEVFLYGINVLLFVIAAYVLMKKSRGFTRWYLLASAITTFLACTSNICLSMTLVFRFILRGRSPPDEIVRARHALYLVNNVIADGLLINRCYALWSRSLCIIVIPSLFLLVSSICGVIFLTDKGDHVNVRKPIYLWMTLALNISVTVLSATRIWWMGRKAREILGPQLANKYYSAMAIIVESGAIYSSYVLLAQILAIVNPSFFILDAGLSQFVVIAPTLVVVQLGLGNHAREVEAAVQRSRRTSTVVLSTVQTS